MKITTLIFTTFWLIMFAGWSQNLYKLVKADFEAPYKTEIIRCVSLVPIVGGITGWMDIGEEN